MGDTYYDSQKFLDIRDITIEDLKNCDAVVSLAAVSNDPIGKDFENAKKQLIMRLIADWLIYVLL